MFIKGKAVLTSVSAYVHWQHLLADLICSSQRKRPTISVATVLFLTCYSLLCCSFSLEERTKRKQKNEISFLSPGDSRLKEKPVNLSCLAQGFSVLSKNNMLLRSLTLVEPSYNKVSANNTSWGTDKVWNIPTAQMYGCFTGIHPTWSKPCLQHLGRN